MFKATLRQRRTTSKKMELRSLAVVDRHFSPIRTIFLHEDIEEE